MVLSAYVSDPECPNLLLLLLLLVVGRCRFIDSWPRLDLAQMIAHLWDAKVGLASYSQI